VGVYARVRATYARARGFACVSTQARAEARRCREPAGGAVTGATRHAASNASGGAPRARQAGVPLSSSQWRRRTAAQRAETSATARPQAPCRCRARLRGRRERRQGAAQRERIRSPEPLADAPLASAARARCAFHAATRHSEVQWNVLCCTDCSVASDAGCTLQKPDTRTLLLLFSQRTRRRCPSTGFSALASSVVQLASERRSSTYGVSVHLRRAREG
jgi:hypothetical protein